MNQALEALKFLRATLAKHPTKRLCRGWYDYTSRFGEMQIEVCALGTTLYPRIKVELERAMLRGTSPAQLQVSVPDEIMPLFRTQLNPDNTIADMIVKANDGFNGPDERRYYYMCAYIDGCIARLEEPRWFEANILSVTPRELNFTAELPKEPTLPELDIANTALAPDKELVPA